MEKFELFCSVVVGELSRRQTSPASVFSSPFEAPSVRTLACKKTRTTHTAGGSLL